MGWQSRCALHGRDAVLHRILHLLQGAHLDLATRSREMLNSSASSASVIGSSESRRVSKMRRSRSLSTKSAEASALRRLSFARFMRLAKQAGLLELDMSKFSPSVIHSKAVRQPLADYFKPPIASEH